MTLKRVRIAEPGQYISTGIKSCIKFNLEDKQEKLIEKHPVSCLKISKRPDTERENVCEDTERKNVCKDTERKNVCEDTERNNANNCGM